MPAPVFLVFSATRERVGLSVAEAAQRLGVSPSYLWDLEQFRKVCIPRNREAGTDFEDRVRAFFDQTAETVMDDPVLAETTARLKNPAFYQAAVWRDAFFRSGLAPLMEDVFIAPRGTYGMLFSWWSRWISEHAGNEWRLRLPRDGKTAWFLRYAWTRAWGGGKRHRSLGRSYANISFAPSDDSCLGVLSDSLTKALGVSPTNPPWLASFAPLLFYIMTKDVNVPCDDQALTAVEFVLHGYQADIAVSVVLEKKTGLERVNFEPVSGELTDSEKVLQAWANASKFLT